MQVLPRLRTADLLSACTYQQAFGRPVGQICQQLWSSPIRCLYSLLTYEQFWLRTVWHMNISRWRRNMGKTYMFPAQHGIQLGILQRLLWRLVFSVRSSCWNSVGIVQTVYTAVIVFGDGGNEHLKWQMGCHSHWLICPWFWELLWSMELHALRTILYHLLGCILQIK